MSRVDQKQIDRYFKGDRAEYVKTMRASLARHTQETKSHVDAERAKADLELAKIQKEIEDNQ